MCLSLSFDFELVRMRSEVANSTLRDIDGMVPKGSLDLIGEHDWSGTSLGAHGNWPLAASTVVTTILESKQPMYMLWGPERTLIYNDAYRPLLGAKHPAALGSPFLAVWSEAADSLKLLVDRVFAGHSDYRDDIELMLDRGNGLMEAHFSFSLSPVRDSDGRIGGVIGVCAETTASVLAERNRRITEDRLRESEDNYRHAVELNPQVSWTADPTGKIDRLSDKWLELTGRSGLGDAWALSFHPDDVAASHDAWSAAVRSGLPFGIEHRIRLRSGDYRWFRSKAFARHDAEGRLVRWYGSTEDIHDRKLSEDRLRDMQSELVHLSRFTALGEMASALAHELNQPLTAVTNYLAGCREMLGSASDAQGAAIREAIGEAIAQALRAGDIIRSLRTFVTRAEERRQVVALDLLINETKGLALIGSAQIGIDLEMRIEANLHALVDRVQIQQVLLNIIRNAIEAMQRRSLRRLVIEATASSCGAGIEITISDTGGGIHPAVFGRLFEPFQTTKPNGMGVGLSICRTIVETHGGRILAETELDVGTTIRLSFPRVMEEDYRRAA